MKKLVVTLLYLTITVATVTGARAVAAESFRPAAAAEAHPAPTGAVGPATLTVEDTLDAEMASATARPIQAQAESVAITIPVSAASAPTSVEAAPLAAPVLTPAPAPVVAAPAPAPAACAATWFCYPRLGIAGPIVPYGDCLGTTDIGEGIRSFSCISPFYLMGHAYTQFGAITAWQAGDVVFASGRRFVISTAFVQSSCEPPAGTIAPLSLQTSLTSGGCGRVLVVQGR